MVIFNTYKHQTIVNIYFQETANNTDVDKQINQLTVIIKCWLYYTLYEKKTCTLNTYLYIYISILVQAKLINESKFVHQLDSHHR